MIFAVSKLIIVEFSFCYAIEISMLMHIRSLPRCTFLNTRLAQHRSRRTVQSRQGDLRSMGVPSRGMAHRRGAGPNAFRAAPNRSEKERIQGTTHGADELLARLERPEQLTRQKIRRGLCLDGFEASKGVHVGRQFCFAMPHAPLFPSNPMSCWNTHKKKFETRRLTV